MKIEAKPNSPWLFLAVAIFITPICLFLMMTKLIIKEIEDQITGRR